MLGVPPDRYAPRELRAAHFLRQVDRTTADRYYRQCILPDVVEDVREQVRQLRPSHWPRNLVTIVSDSPELIELTARAFTPTRILVLYSEQKKVYLEPALEAVRRDVPGCDPIPHSFHMGPSMIADMREGIDTFTAGVSPEDLVFDLTPGNKEMSLALAMELAPPGAWLFYLRHQFEGRTPKPFTEEAVLSIAPSRETSFLVPVAASSERR